MDLEQLFPAITTKTDLKEISFHKYSSLTLSKSFVRDSVETTKTLA